MLWFRLGCVVYGRIPKAALPCLKPETLGPAGPQKVPRDRMWPDPVLALVLWLRLGCVVYGGVPRAAHRRLSSRASVPAGPCCVRQRPGGGPSPVKARGLGSGWSAEGTRATECGPTPFEFSGFGSGWAVSCTAASRRWPIAVQSSKPWLQVVRIANRRTSEQTLQPLQPPPLTLPTAPSSPGPR